MADRLLAADNEELRRRLVAAEAENAFLCSQVVELQERVRVRDLKLFWKDNHKYNLEKLMYNLNLDFMRCACESCRIGARSSADEDALVTDRDGPCAFTRGFNERLQKAGLTVVVRRISEEPIPGFVDQPDCSDNADVAYDVDAHFHLHDGPNWTLWNYGRRLWGATSVDDPELRRLVHLIKSMEEEIDTAGQQFRYCSPVV